jgi:hypothetical protein
MNLIRFKPSAADGNALPGTVGALLLAAALGLPAVARAQAPFDTPEQATNALIDAIAVNDASRLPRLLGKTWKQILPLDEVPAEYRYQFLEKAYQSRVIEVNGDRAELVVGTDPWTLPIPLQKTAQGKWRFDPVGALEAVLELRIGTNERAAIQSSLAYVDAQREYAAKDRNGDGLLEYAQKFLSSPGKRDGLIWSESLGDDSPLGENYLPSRPGGGYYGYRYKILTGQGPNARGGARSYLVGKRMIGGFALLGWPVRYGDTGVMSFIVNQDGQVYQRDLGPGTASVVNSIKRFDPDESWKPTKP